MSGTLTSSNSSDPGLQFQRQQSETNLHQALAHSQSRAREAEVALRTFDRLLDEAVEAIALWACDKAPDRVADAKQIETILTSVVCWRASERTRGGRRNSSSSKSGSAALPKEIEQTGLLAVLAAKNEACRQSKQLRRRVMGLLGRSLVTTRQKAMNSLHRTLVARWAVAARTSRSQFGATALVAPLAAGRQKMQPFGASNSLLRAAFCAAGVALVLGMAYSTLRHLQQLILKRRAGNMRMQSLKALGPLQYLPQAAWEGVQRYATAS